MPIEIKELVIKTTVVDTHNRDKKAATTTANLAEIKEQLLAECKAYFDEKLKEQKRR